MPKNPSLQGAYVQSNASFRGIPTGHIVHTLCGWSNHKARQLPVYSLQLGRFIRLRMYAYQVSHRVRCEMEPACSASAHPATIAPTCATPSIHASGRTVHNVVKGSMESGLPHPLCDALHKSCRILLFQSS